MAALIEKLIDKVDGLEIVRDQIAAILVLELAEQQQKALAAGKDPELWRLRVFTEQSNPLGGFQVKGDGDATEVEDGSPIVNVSFNDDTFDMSRSNIIERQVAVGTFHIDCYGHGISRDTGIGHDPGDARAAMESQRAARLVRNILMAAAYADLGLEGLVWRRWVASRTSLQPQIDARPGQHVVALRIAMQVEFNEFSPQFEGNPLELISIEVKRAENGQVLLTADYPHTP